MIKRFLVKLIAILIVLPFVSCVFENDLPERYASSYIGKERTSFWTITNMENYANNPSGWKKVSVERKFVGEHVIIYIDKKYKNSKSDAELEELGNEFDNHIYDKVTTYFAKPYDLDRNKKVAIVIIDLPSDYAGYFFNVDFYNNEYVKKYNEQSGTCLKSNEGDIVYLNRRISGNDHFYGTAAHEFMHLVSASYSIKKDQDSLDTWIEEGLAEAANHLYLNKVVDGKQVEKVIQDRIQDFNRNRDAINRGYPLFRWGKDTPEKLINYSLSYLFFQFLYNHANEKEKIFKNIIASGHANYKAIIDAMNKDANLKEWGSTGTERFHRLLLRFYASNAGVTGADYGYGKEFFQVLAGSSEDAEKEFVIDDATYTYGKRTLDLGTGAGVAVDMFNALRDFNDDCIYLSVSLDGSFEDFSGVNMKDDVLNKLIAVNKTYSTGSYAFESVTLPDSNISRQRSMFIDNDSVEPVDNDSSIDLVIPSGLIEDLNNFELSQ